MAQTIDATGLPDGVVRDIQRFVESVRQNLGRPAAAPAGAVPPDQWVAQFRAWAEGHPRRDIAIADDRDAIDAGCAK